MAFICITPTLTANVKSLCGFRSRSTALCCTAGLSNNQSHTRSETVSPSVGINRRSFVSSLALSAFCANVLQYKDSALAVSSSEEGEKDVVQMAQVQTQDLKVGTGESPETGKKLFMHYTLTLGGFEEAGGKVVDSSRKRGSLFSYKFDTGAVIKGWDQGVKGMKVGGTRLLIVPSELGYGASGAGGVIPPNATLYFDIELVRID